MFMANNPSNPAIGKTHSEQSFVQRCLDPTERLGEVLFGLVMVLTITLGMYSRSSQSIPVMSARLSRYWKVRISF